MEILWFCAVAFMLAAYVILDGFDLGAGVLHLLVARNENERRTVLNAIGPFWDGNEVWILAAGGTLYFAFPLLYASSFSGFYLPLTMVLWLLMLRGLGIELRHHVDHPLWKTFWDGVFAFGSVMLTIVLGAALGNVVRGVPLADDGYFFEPLWTSFTVQPDAGILDWFTVLMGLVALSSLTTHAAHFLAMKTSGFVQQRARRMGGIVWWATAGTSLAGIFAARAIRPSIWDNFDRYPWGYVVLLLAVAGLMGVRVFARRNRDTCAFLSSSLFIGGMLASTAFSLFPVVLPASTDARFSLTIYNTAAQEYGLWVGLLWWTIGMIIALGYFAYIFYIFRGKVQLREEGY
jgi:cytochrome bd ubiquinol oxidase subunit II